MVNFYSIQIIISTSAKTVCRGKEYYSIMSEVIRGNALNLLGLDRHMRGRDIVYVYKKKNTKST